MKHTKRPPGLLPTTQALAFLGWGDKMSNRIKLGKIWKGDTVQGHAKVRWYWEKDLQELLTAPTP